MYNRIHWGILLKCKQIIDFRLNVPTIVVKKVFASQMVDANVSMGILEQIVHKFLAKIM